MLWEYQFLTKLQEFRMPLLDKAMVMLSHLGDGALLWIILAVVLFLMAGTRRIGRDMIVAMIVALIIGNLIVKNVIGRVRPYDVYTMLQPLVDRPSDWSFPSGHTMHSFAAATVLFLHERKAGIAALLLAAGIGFSRLYNMVHYPTDVLAGMLIGIVIAVLVYRFFRMGADRGLDSAGSDR